MTIGQFSQVTGTPVETIRFYERIGLLVPTRRRPSGYREYGRGDVQRLTFIRRAKELGFSLREIRELLELRVDSKNACEDVRRKAEAKIRDVEARIRELQRIKSALEVLAASCQDTGPEGECPILAALDQVDPYQPENGAEPPEQNLGR